jgi:hypothetical protein
MFRLKSSIAYRLVQVDDEIRDPKIFDSIGHVWLIIHSCYFQYPSVGQRGFCNEKEWGRDDQD